MTLDRVMPLLAHAATVGDSLTECYALLHASAADVLRVADMARPEDDLQAEVLRGIVQRAQLVLRGDYKARRH